MGRNGHFHRVVAYILRFEGTLGVSHACASEAHLKLERRATTMRASVFIKVLSRQSRFVVPTVTRKGSRIKSIPFDLFRDTTHALSSSLLFSQKITWIIKKRCRELSFELFSIHVKLEANIFHRVIQCFEQ